MMMLEPDERTTTIVEQQAAIAGVLASGSSTIVLAETGDQLAGYAAASGGRYRRERRTAYVVAGVRQAYAGRGIGGRLFDELERWARERGLHRLELTVQTRNLGAQRLYHRAGFEIEGMRRHALLIDGAYVDELYMAKLLG
jgi:RimJ/RimL family protein N-acetyltransferase